MLPRVRFCCSCLLSRVGYICELFVGQTFVLGAKSERNLCACVCVFLKNRSLPSVLEVINFQWQLIISEEKLEVVWLFCLVEAQQSVF